MLWHEYSKRLEGVEDSISDVEIAPNPAPEVERDVAVAVQSTVTSWSPEEDEQFST